MTQNSTSRRCWAYETTNNVAGISGATDTSYYFGKTDDSDEKWTPPAPELNVQAFHDYSQRMPMGISKLDPNYPDFPVSYNPTTAQFLGRFLGSNTSGTPCTHAPLDSGVQVSMTFRLEQRGGSQERVSQAVGCQTVGIDLLGRLDGKLKCDETLAWGFYEDEVDRDVLTTEPTHAGNLSNPDSYEGRPQFTWNGYQMNCVVSARFSQRQNYEKSYDPSTGKRQVYKYSYQPAQVFLEAIFNEASGYAIFDDWIDRTKRNCQLRFYKSDNENYVQLGMSGIVTNIKETAIRHKGHYLAQITIQAIGVSGTSNFNNEGSGFTTHFKGVS